MSYIKKCNICGKTEKDKNIIFSGNELALNIPSYDGKNYNIYMLFGLVYDKDEILINNYKAQQENIEFETFIKQILIKNNNINKPNMLPLELKEPEPLICNKCKRGISYLMWQYGVVGKPIKF